MALGRAPVASMAFGRASPTKMNSAGTMRFDLGSVGKSIGNFFTNSFLPWVDKAVGEGLNWISPHLNNAYQGIKQDIKEGKNAGDVILGALDKGRHAAGDILDKIPGGAAFKPIADAVNTGINAIKKDPNPVGVINGITAAAMTPGAIDAVGDLMRPTKRMKMINDKVGRGPGPNINLQPDPPKAPSQPNKKPQTFNNRFTDPFAKDPRDILKNPTPWQMLK